jgi:hypothetical protein
MQFYIWKDRRKETARWENNIKIGLREIGCGGMDWINLAQEWWFLKDSDLSSYLVNTFFFYRLLQ